MPYRKRCRHSCLLDKVYAAIFSQELGWDYFGGTVTLALAMPSAMKTFVAMGKVM